MTAIRHVARGVRLMGQLLHPGQARHRALAELSAGGKRLFWRPRHRPCVAIALVEHLGDIVAAEPLVRALRAARPDAYLVWVCRPAFASVPASHPDIDAVLPARCLSEWIHLRSSRVFDEVIDLHVPGRFCEVCNQRLVRPDVSGMDVTNYYRHGSLLQIACIAAGHAQVAGPPRVHIPEGAAQRVDALHLPARYCCVHTRSNQPERDWENPRWNALAGKLEAELDLPVVEVGLRATIDPAAAPRYRDMCGKLAILETAEVIRRSALFIGIDSGPAHLANAVGAPGVVLLGQYRTYDRYMPFSGGYADGTGATVIHASGPAATIDVQTVMEAAYGRIGPGVTIGGGAR